MSGDDRAARVLEFWHNVEIFSPSNVPKLEPHRVGSNSAVMDLGADEFAPWEDGHELREEPLADHQSWQFTVYGGLYDITAVRDTLTRTFGQDAKPADARPSSGETALFAVTLDQDGFLIEDSATLSTCAWALGMLTAYKAPPSTLSEFALEEAEFSQQLNRLVPPSNRRRAGEDADDDCGSRSSDDTSSPGLAADLVERARSAAGDAWSAGAEAAGEAVKGLVTSITPPVIGGIAGAAAGAFTKSMVGPSDDDEQTKTCTDSSPGPAEPQNSPRPPRLRFTAAALHSFVRELANALGVADSLDPSGVRVRCAKVGPRSNEADSDFLNSLIATDLTQVSHAVSRGHVGPALKAYLSDTRELNTQQRVDVRKNPEAVVEGVQPEQIPGGRWPTDPAKPLALSQQFAVNKLVEQLAHDADLFSVNGPPGTGKTTMLRDVLAAIVVQRAHQLAQLRNPREAFTHEVEAVQVTETYSARVHGLREELTGFEVVLATATNGAAQNVTAEIPVLDAVDGYSDEALAADYFTELAGHVLDKPAWGLIAATLGNRHNRKIFAKRFWWGDETRSQHRRSDDDAQPPTGMHKLLKTAGALPLEENDWKTAVDRFRDAHARVDDLGAERQRVADAISRVQSCRAALREAEEVLSTAESRCERLRVEISEAKSRLERAQKAFRAADGEYDEHLQRRPGFWISLLTLFRALRDWHSEYEDLRHHRKTAQAEHRSAESAVAKRETELQRASAERERAVETRETATAELNATLDVVREASQRWPHHLPIPDEFADDDDFQKCAPWADSEFVTARNQLFLEALRLHKAFLSNTHNRMNGNLRVIMGVLDGSLHPSPRGLLAAWQSLFLVVPMISTTFASIPRLFNGLGQESLGWLFIDEAGQAAPQEAVGGLWRCRRAVIVGDPQQLEPITSLPSSAQHALRKEQDVDEQWTPDDISTQSVADRLMRFGTMLPGPDDESGVWVGSPLRVHRRCDRPMFDLSNNIAYGGTLMVYGTKHSGEAPGENCWLDVRSAVSQGNWVPAEGAALIGLLEQLEAQGVPTASIRVVSPFRDAVSGAKTLVRHRFGRAFAEHNVGTVHTVQGKESDVIIIVLGSAPDRVGARSWASKKPNLLNVAVSRAKRRLYVIGNHPNWKDLRYFDQLAAALPIHRSQF